MWMECVLKGVRWSPKQCLRERDKYLHKSLLITDASRVSQPMTNDSGGIKGEQTVMKNIPDSCSDISCALMWDCKGLCVCVHWQSQSVPKSMIYDSKLGAESYDTRVGHIQTIRHIHLDIHYCHCLGKCSSLAFPLSTTAVKTTGYYCMLLHSNTQ